MRREIVNSTQGEYSDLNRKVVNSTQGGVSNLRMNIVVDSSDLKLNCSHMTISIWRFQLVDSSNPKVEYSDNTISI